MEVTDAREAHVGTIRVRRALPRRARRTVGPWCFADHMAPAEVGRTVAMAVGPHPHIGLATVTWLVAGEVLHRDSLGFEQLIRPGELNLMTAGHGVAHAEESPPGARGPLHGVQLWVAQPETTRHGAPAFEHHPALPVVDLGAGSATILVGEAIGAASPARRDTDHVGIDLDLRPGRVELELIPAFEHAVLPVAGRLEVEGRTVAPGQLGFLEAGRSGLEIRAPQAARALLIGGAPFEEPVFMWWNFVARDGDEISEAYRDWMSDGRRHERFGRVASPLPPIPVDAPAWLGSSG